MLFCGTIVDLEYHGRDVVTVETNPSRLEIACRDLGGKAGMPIRQVV
jgi:hypothetical protein